MQHQLSSTNNTFLRNIPLWIYGNSHLHTLMSMQSHNATGVNHTVFDIREHSQYSLASTEALLWLCSPMLVKEADRYCVLIMAAVKPNMYTTKQFIKDQ